jgi:predicted nucleic acid-binding protein
VTYLLDSNIFIQGKNLHYQFDFCPGFWDWLDRANNEGKLYSVEKVLEELRGVRDELTDWAEDRESLFLAPDEEVLASLRIASAWVRGAGYGAAAVNTFLQDADYYLVAHAHAKGCTVVTQELAGKTMKKVQIPDVCIGLKVKCVTPWSMLATEGARFVLA